MGALLDCPCQSKESQKPQVGRSSARLGGVRKCSKLKTVTTEDENVLEIQAVERVGVSGAKEAVLALEDDCPGEQRMTDARDKENTCGIALVERLCLQESSEILSPKNG